MQAPDVQPSSSCQAHARKTSCTISNKTYVVPIDSYNKLQWPREINNFVKYLRLWKPASFNLDAVMTTLEDAGGGANH
jgi:hypothetical protein